MFLLDLKPEVQEANNLCWAAVSTMALRAFPQQGKFRHLTQRKTVIYREAEIRTLSDLANARLEDDPNHGRFKGASKACRKTGSCNLTSPDLHLFDVKTAKCTADKALSLEHFRIELEDRKRPVAIRWSYEGKLETNGRLRTGDHALLVTGYNPECSQLRIFDPWPAASDPDPEPAPHEKWISYESYLNPKNDHGQDAVAVHEFDEFRMQRVDDNQQIVYPAFADIPPRLVRQGNCVPFDRKIPELQDAIRKFMRSHVVRNSSGAVIHGPYDTGRPVPIVPHTRAALLRDAHDPSALFKKTTSTVAVPLLRRGKLIDSIMMLHDKNGWHPGGYCSNKVTSLLLKAREQHAGKSRKERDFYLVSIPEISTFYVAHGFHDKADVAALNRRELKRLRQCRESFGELIKCVRCEDRERAELRETLMSA